MKKHAMLLLMMVLSMMASLATSLPFQGCGSWDAWFNGTKTTGKGLNAPSSVASVNSLVMTSINPASGPLVGGGRYVITGRGFNTDAKKLQVFFGKVLSAPDTVRETNTVLEGGIPGGVASGKVAITIRDLDRNLEVVFTDAYEYLSTAVPPQLASITPNSGPQTGGTSITLFGEGLQPGIEVFVGAKFATVASVTSSLFRTATVVTPANTSGSADVEVRNSLGSSKLASVFTYTATAAAVATTAVAVVQSSVALLADVDVGTISAVQSKVTVKFTRVNPDGLDLIKAITGSQVVSSPSGQTSSFTLSDFTTNNTVIANLPTGTTAYSLVIQAEKSSGGSVKCETNGVSAIVTGSRPLFRPSGQ